MGLFTVSFNAAPGVQYDGVLYHPGAVVSVPPARAGDLPFSVNDAGRKVYDKLLPLDDEALAMVGLPPAAPTEP